MKNIIFISLVSFIILSGCSGMSGSVGESAPKCADAVVGDKIVRNCR